MKLCPYRILSSTVLMISGTVLVLHAILVVKSEHLKVDKFIGSILLERDSFQFHAEIVGCAYISTVFGICQAVTSLMYFINEFNLRGWIWVNFSCVLAYCVCIFLLEKPKLVLQSFTEYYLSLIANTFLSTAVLFMGVLFRVFSNLN